MANKTSDLVLEILRQSPAQPWLSSRLLRELANKGTKISKPTLLTELYYLQRTGYVQPALYRGIQHWQAVEELESDSANIAPASTQLPAHLGKLLGEPLTLGDALDAEKLDDVYYIGDPNWATRKLTIRRITVFNHLFPKGDARRHTDKAEFLQSHTRMNLCNLVMLGLAKILIAADDISRPLRKYDDGRIVFAGVADFPYPQYSKTPGGASGVTARQKVYSLGYNGLAPPPASIRSPA